MGIAADGMGSCNLKTAMAGSTHLDTAIRLDRYIGEVMDGAALNAILEQLNAPDISPSSFRLTPVPISIEDIRRIPFHRGDRNIVFSMQKLSFQGKWPVALQDDAFVDERRRYEAALDDALEHTGCTCSTPSKIHSGVTSRSAPRR